VARYSNSHGAETLEFFTDNPVVKIVEVATDAYPNPTALLEPPHRGFPHQRNIRNGI
jgi:hypothetical protein